MRQLALGAQTAGFQLFDLENEIGETADLAGRQPGVLKELLAEIEAMNAQMVAPLWDAWRPLARR